MAKTRRPKQAKTPDQAKFDAFMRAVQAAQVKYGFQIVAEPTLQEGKIGATIRIVKAGP